MFPDAFYDNRDKTNSDEKDCTDKLYPPSVDNEGDSPSEERCKNVHAAEGDYGSDQSSASSDSGTDLDHGHQEGLVTKLSEEHKDEAENFSLPVIPVDLGGGIVGEESVLELDFSIVV